MVRDILASCSTWSSIEISLQDSEKQPKIQDSLVSVGESTTIVRVDIEQSKPIVVDLLIRTAGGRTLLEFGSSATDVGGRRKSQADLDWSPKIHSNGVLRRFER